MYVTFEEYAGFGYDSVPESKFERYVLKSGYMVEKWTLNRVTDAILNSGDETIDTDIRKRIEWNKRGLCEITELIYANENPVLGESGAAIKSFSNEGYSETLAGMSQDEFDQRLLHILSTFFTQEQLCRRGG